jgi:hypothetical protein
MMIVDEEDLGALYLNGTSKCTLYISAIMPINAMIPSWRELLFSVRFSLWLEG